MGVSDYWFVCLIGALPGPPSVNVDNANIQLFPINKNKCHYIDPVRDISFQLFTRHNPLMPTPLRIGDDEALANSHFNFSDPTIFFFHAFFESYQHVPATYIRTAYTQRGDHNILLLNAPRLEAGPWYLTAAENTRIVGQYAAQFIDYLVSRGLYLPSLHLTGLSLGAQMAGVCGQHVKSGRIRRITGLDPAGPLFTKWPKSLKLDASDAEFVDVIHTDAGIFGYPRQIGHVDFWPNKGIAPQPGCNFKQVKKRNPDALLEYGPPKVQISNSTFQLWNVNRRKCEEVDPYRDTIFYLYKSNFSQSPKVIVSYDDESLTISGIDFSVKTVIFFHGFLESYLADDAQSIKNAYLEKGNYNIILVQNERLLAGPDYVNAAGNCKPIGKFSAIFIDYLVSKGLKLEDLHVIGLSLGGQIAGMTGQFLKSGKLPRITALDPAGPLFNGKPIDERLDPTDANFVDVIFTNSGTFGMKYSVGHLNFWPNGGRKQPGCSLREILHRYGLAINWIVFCHHYRSYQLYVESIKFPHLFPSIRCTSYIKYSLGLCKQDYMTYMGIAAKPEYSGNYFINTGYTGIYNG